MKKKLRIKKVEEIKRFRFTGEDGTVELIDFVPQPGLPGFSHRVAYNGLLTHTYLGDAFRPNQKNALEMLDILRSAVATGNLDAERYKPFGAIENAAA